MIFYVKSVLKESNTLYLVRYRLDECLQFCVDSLRSALTLLLSQHCYSRLRMLLCLRLEERWGWILSFHFLDLCLHVHAEIKSVQPLFLAWARTTLLHPNPNDSYPPPSKAYLKTCSSKLYLSFLEGRKKYWSLTNGKLAVTCLIHLSDREVENIG